MRVILNEFSYCRVSRGREVVERTVLKELSLTVDGLSSRKATDCRVKKMDKSKQRNRDELEQAEERITELEGAVRGYGLRR